MCLQTPIVTGNFYHNVLAQKKGQKTEKPDFQALGTNEFCCGCLEALLHSHGIAMQVTAPFVHSQNRKIECFIQTLEDEFQTLLADSGLSISFWGDAVLTVTYIRNRFPMSVLPSDTMPYEEMEHSKPNLSHLRVWGCQCFVAIPPELCLKGGPHCFEAIFVGYVENPLRWHVRDLNSKYHFSCDVLSNDLVPGLLSSSIPFHLLPPLILFTSSLQLMVKHSMMLLSFKTITIQEALWIRLFLTIHRLLVPQPFPFLCDNQNTLTLIKSEAISHLKFK